MKPGGPWDTILDLSQQTGSAKTYGGRILQNTSEIFSLGILSLVGQARLAGGEQIDRSTFAPHEGRLVRRKSVFCKCVLGGVYTEHQRLHAVLGAPTAPLQSQGTFGVPTMVGYPPHSAMLGCPWWCCNARVPTASLHHQGSQMSSGASPGRPHHWSMPGGPQPRQLPLPFLWLPSLWPTLSSHPPSAVPSIMACRGQEAGRVVSAGVPRDCFFPLRLHGSLAGWTGQVGRQNLRVQLLLQDRNCKPYLLGMKNYPGKRFLSYEMHLLIILQKPSSPSLVLPPLRFSVLPLTSLPVLGMSPCQAAKQHQPCCLS